MNCQPYVQSGIEILAILVVSYFLFYKSWVKELGKQVAKLSTIEQLTKLEEGVKKDFNIQLESYKSSLSAELSREIEPLKAELEKNNITYQIQFEYLHKKRSKVVLQIYRRLIEMYSAFMDWTQLMHPVIKDADLESQERTKRVNVATNEFKNFYLTNKLFFSREFCQFIDGVFKEYWEKGWEFGYGEDRVKSGQLTEENFRHYSEQMTTISTEIRDSFPKRIEEIEDRFRKILRVED